MRQSTGPAVPEANCERVRSTHCGLGACPNMGDRSEADFMSPEQGISLSLECAACARLAWEVRSSRRSAGSTLFPGSQRVARPAAAAASDRARRIQWGSRSGVCIVVIHQRVGFCVERGRFQSPRLPSRRAKQDPTGATIEINQRCAGFGHVTHGEDYRDGPSSSPVRIRGAAAH